MAEKYFNAEKAESLLFVLVGLAAIISALWFLIQVKKPFYLGMAWPLIAVAIIQLTVGFTVYFRSPKDISRVNTLLTQSNEKAIAEEVPRMNTVIKNFTIYRVVEIVLLLIGLGMLFFLKSNAMLMGIGTGLAIQAGFMQLLDYFAEKRAHEYLKFVENLGT